MRDSRRWGRRGLFAMLAAMVVVSLLCSWKFGVIWPNQSFRGGFKPLVRELSAAQRLDYEALHQLLATIPNDAELIVSGRVGAHASNRPRVYSYREWRPAEFLLVHEKDVRGAKKTEHQKRVKSGQLELVKNLRRFSLYRVAWQGP